MKTLLLIASSLGRDGTSRFITYFVNNYAKRDDIRINVLFFRSVPEDLLEELDKNVDVNSLHIESKLWRSTFKVINEIVKIKPDYCLLGFHQLLWLSFLSPLFHVYGIKILMRDTIIPTLFHANEGKLKKLLNKLAYRRFDKIITQSIDMHDDLVTNWGCDINKMILINNPVDIDAVKARVSECPEELRNKNTFTFVAAGRLTYQKGYDIIINRMAELTTSPKFQLLILGSGELDHQLKDLVIEKGVSEYVHFLGYRNNVASYLYYADALLLTSRYEGFPNIVLEANALGKPVFTNACKGGVNEIILQGVNGVSCNFESSAAFEKGLVSFFETKFNSHDVIRTAQNRYDISIIMEKYSKVFIH